MTRSARAARWRRVSEQCEQGREPDLVPLEDYRRNWVPFREENQATRRPVRPYLYDRKPDHLRATIAALIAAMVETGDA